MIVLAYFVRIQQRVNAGKRTQLNHSVVRSSSQNQRNNCLKKIGINICMHKRRSVHVNNKSRAFLLLHGPFAAKCRNKTPHNTQNKLNQFRRRNAITAARN